MRAPFAVDSFRIDSIKVDDKRRAVNAATVDRLADSIARIGLQTPITCRLLAEDETCDEDAILVAGRHRLEACRKLGWDKVPAFIWEADASSDEARMWEISENLHRSELSALERDEQVAEWVSLADAVLRQTAAKPQGGRPQGGVRAAARDIGVSDRDARRAVKVAGLSDEAKAEARALGLDDNRSALLRAASAPQPVQALREMKASKLADRPLNDLEAQERQVAALMAAWNRATAEARAEFLARIDTPVFDSGLRSSYAI